MLGPIKNWFSHNTACTKAVEVISVELGHQVWGRSCNFLLTPFYSDEFLEWLDWNKCSFDLSSQKFCQYLASPSVMPHRYLWVCCMFYFSSLSIISTPDSTTSVQLQFLGCKYVALKTNSECNLLFWIHWKTNMLRADHLEIHLFSSLVQIIQITLTHC